MQVLLPLQHHTMTWQAKEPTTVLFAFLSSQIATYTSVHLCNLHDMLLQDLHGQAAQDK